MHFLVRIAIKGVVKVEDVNLGLVSSSAQPASALTHFGSRPEFPEADPTSHPWNKRNPPGRHKPYGRIFRGERLFNLRLRPSQPKPAGLTADWQMAKMMVIMAMKIASVAEIKAKFSAFLKASEGGPIIVTRNGRPVAVIVGVQDEDEIERLLMAYSPHLQANLNRSRQQFREGKCLGEEEFWSQFEDAKPAKVSAKPKQKPGPDSERKQHFRDSNSHRRGR